MKTDFWWTGLPTLQQSLSLFLFWNVFFSSSSSSSSFILMWFSSGFYFCIWYLYRRIRLVSDGSVVFDPFVGRLFIYAYECLSNYRFILIFVILLYVLPSFGIHITYHRPWMLWTLHAFLVCLSFSFIFFPITFRLRWAGLQFSVCFFWIEILLLIIYSIFFSHSKSRRKIEIGFDDIASSFVNPFLTLSTIIITDPIRLRYCWFHKWKLNYYFYAMTFEKKKKRRKIISGSFLFFLFPKF